MAISFDKALGVHQYTVGLRAERAEILASNLANANTGNYKAKDLDFSRALQAAKSKLGFRLNGSDGRHISSSQKVGAGVILYRIPIQPDTGDGNTVDTQLERNLFMQNTIEYQASLDLLSSKFRNMTKAFKGE